MQKYCTKCGKEFLPEDKFCGNCGFHLEELSNIATGSIEAEFKINSKVSHYGPYGLLEFLYVNFLSYLYLLLVIILLSTGLFLNNLSRISRFVYDYLTIWLTLFLILSHIVLLIGMFCKKSWAQRLHFIIFVEFIFFMAWLFNNYNSQPPVLVLVVLFAVLSVNTWLSLFKAKYL